MKKINLREIKKQVRRYFKWLFCNRFDCIFTGVCKRGGAPCDICNHFTYSRCASCSWYSICPYKIDGVFSRKRDTLLEELKQAIAEKTFNNEKIKEEFENET